jgi:hypothetical protein
MEGNKCHKQFSEFRTYPLLESVRYFIFTGYYFLPLDLEFIPSQVNINIYKSIALPVLLYECETWPLNLTHEHRLRRFENRMLRRISGPKLHKGIRWERLNNVQLHNFY